MRSTRVSCFRTGSRCCQSDPSEHLVRGTRRASRAPRGLGRRALGAAGAAAAADDAGYEGPTIWEQGEEVWQAGPQWMTGRCGRALRQSKQPCPVSCRVIAHGIRTDKHASILAANCWSPIRVDGRFSLFYIGFSVCKGILLPDVNHIAVTTLICCSIREVSIMQRSLAQLHS